MTVGTKTAMAYVVRDDQARVVVIFWGADAEEESARWLERGYRVDEVDSAAL